VPSKTDETVMGETLKMHIWKILDLDKIYSEYENLRIYSIAAVN
jgi:hypothetical protein